MDTDVRSVLSAIRVPTLVTHQVGDRLVNPACGLHLAENIEDAVVGELPGENLPPFAAQLGNQQRQNLSALFGPGLATGVGSSIPHASSLTTGLGNLFGGLGR